MNTMEEETSGLRKDVTRVFLLLLVTNLAAIAAGLLGTTRTLYLFVTIGGVAAFMSAVSYGRTKGAKDKKQLGRAAMQGLWVNCSMALGYFLTAPAPYFSSPAIVWGVALVAGGVAIVASVYFLFRVHRTTGVPFSV